MTPPFVWTDSAARVALPVLLLLDLDGSAVRHAAPAWQPSAMFTDVLVGLGA